MYLLLHLELGILDFLTLCQQLFYKILVSDNHPFVQLYDWQGILFQGISPSCWISVSMLAWPGSRWDINTKAALLSGVKLRKNCSKDSSPPAEAPNPTIGKLTSCFFCLSSFLQIIPLKVLQRQYFHQLQEMLNF